MAEQGFIDRMLQGVPQRVMPGGPTGYEGRRTITDFLGSFLGGTLGAVGGPLGSAGGSAVGGELGEWAGETGPGRFINNIGSTIGGWFGGDNGGAYTGAQLAPFNPGASLWNINPLVSNSIGYQGFGSGTGARPYQGTPASASGQEMYNNAIAGSQGYTDQRNHTNTPNGMQGITSGLGRQGSGQAGPNIYSNRAPSSTYQGQTGAASTLAGAGRGQTVGHATMSDVENMLSAGLGRGNPYRTATQRREVNSDRAAMRVAGFERLPGETVVQYRNRATAAGII